MTVLVNGDGVWFIGGEPADYLAWSRRIDPQWLADQLERERVEDDRAVNLRSIRDIRL